MRRKNCCRGICIERNVAYLQLELAQSCLVVFKRRLELQRFCLSPERKARSSSSPSSSSFYMSKQHKPIYDDEDVPAEHSRPVIPGFCNIFLRVCSSLCQFPSPFWPRIVLQRADIWREYEYVCVGESEVFFSHQRLPIIDGRSSYVDNNWLGVIWSMIVRRQRLSTVGVLECDIYRQLQQQWQLS